MHLIRCAVPRVRRSCAYRYSPDIVHLLISLYMPIRLITFYGAFYREGAITIALEYMDGGSLANVLHQVGPVPEHALAAMCFQVLPSIHSCMRLHTYRICPVSTIYVVLMCRCLQILWGLAYLKHEKRVHRDIKPSNLLINSQGEVKVSNVANDPLFIRRCRVMHSHCSAYFFICVP